MGGFVAGYIFRDMKLFESCVLAHNEWLFPKETNVAISNVRVTKAYITMEVSLPDCRRALYLRANAMTLTIPVIFIS